MFLRRLDIFLHFKTYVFQNPQKPVSCHYGVYQLDFFPHIYFFCHQLVKEKIDSEKIIQVFPLLSLKEVNYLGIVS